MFLRSVCVSFYVSVFLLRHFSQFLVLSACLPRTTSIPLFSASLLPLYPPPTSVLTLPLCPPSTGGSLLASSSISLLDILGTVASTVVIDRQSPVRGKLIHPEAD